MKRKIFLFLSSLILVPAISADAANTISTKDCTQESGTTSTTSATQTYKSELVKTRLEFNGINGRPVPAVVKINAQGGKGTAFFTENCTVWTALHALRPNWKRIPVSENTSPIGETFRFTGTDSSGNAFESVAEVLETGDMTKATRYDADGEDWILARDQKCIADQVGELRIFQMDKIDELEGSTMRTLGYPTDPVLGTTGDTLVVDKNCRAMKDISSSFWELSCFAYYGSSGGPAVYSDRFTEAKRIMAVAGIIVGMRDYPDPRKPEFINGRGSRMIPFTGKLLRKVAPYLEDRSKRNPKAL